MPLPSGAIETPRPWLKKPGTPTAGAVTIDQLAWEPDLASYGELRQAIAVLAGE